MTDFKFNKVVVKIGSNVLTNADGNIDQQAMARLADQMSFIKKEGVEIVLVSSGAVASGRAMVSLIDKSDSISSRQVFAAVGQVKLMQNYYELFHNNNISCAQVLVTKEDFRDRVHYLNMRNCFNSLLQNNILPIVNENDVISVTELMFTDNDELAGLIATMIGAEALVILSNVDGIFDGNPKDKASKIISKVDEKMDFSKYVHSTKSDFGRGGMITKSNIARKVASSGITVKISNGKKENVLMELLSDNEFKVGTTFLPSKIVSGAKKQISFAETFAKGEITINQGAKDALLSDRANSLLTVGIVNINGEFQTGDIVKIVDENKNVIGLGKVQYNSKKAYELIGVKNQKAIIHYDYLYLNT
ncbi:MAG: glutamate 5-kinase [Cytophagales bacterium]